jgi:hypothetical protein
VRPAPASNPKEEEAHVVLRWAFFFNPLWFAIWAIK